MSFSKPTPVAFNVTSHLDDGFFQQLPQTLSLFRSRSPINFTITCDENAVDNFDRYLRGFVLNPDLRGLLHGLRIEADLATQFAPVMNSFMAEGWTGLGELILDAISEHYDEETSVPFSLAMFPRLTTLVCNLQTKVTFFSTILNGAPKPTGLTNLKMNTYSSSRDILKLLSETPRLETCQVYLHGDEDGIFSNQNIPSGLTVNLDRLRHLAISEAPHLDILKHIRAPALTRLHIEMQDLFSPDPSGEDPDNYHVMTITDFIHKSQCGVTGLKYLKLTNCPLSDDGLLSILIQAPVLRKLVVWWGPRGDILDYLTRTTATNDLGYTSRIPDIVPHLESLELNLLPDVALGDYTLAEKRSDLYDARRRAFASRYKVTPPSPQERPIPGCFHSILVQRCSRNIEELNVAASAVELN